MQPPAQYPPPLRLARLLARLALLVAVLPMTFQMSPGTPRAAGRIDAYALEGGALLFRGTVTAALAEGIASERTVYARGDGTVLQIIELKYEPSSLKTIRYRLEDPRSGEVESVTAENGSVVLGYRESAEDTEERETLALEPAHLCTELLGAKIGQSLAALQSGQPLLVDLLVPSRQGTVGFQAEYEGPTTVAGEPALVVRAEPSFWLFRMMVAPLRFIFAAAPPHRLLEYRGRSSVKTDDGDPIEVRLVYRSPNAG